MKTVGRYILNNPCRENIAEQWHEYPYRYSNQYFQEQLAAEFFNAQVY